MQAIPLRAVMSADEYDKQHRELETLYGSSDGEATVPAAKRDQAFAELFYLSGWSREQLAERESKTLGWVNLRLRLARFIEYATNDTTVSFDALTEGRFRGYWACTEKGEETARFDEVISLMQAPPQSKKTISQMTEEALEILRPSFEAGVTLTIEQRRALGITEQSRKLAGAVYAGEVRQRAAAMPPKPVVEKPEAIAPVPEPAPEPPMSKPEPVPKPEPEPVAEAPLTPASLSLSAQEKFAALETRLRAQLQADFDRSVTVEVTRHINEYLLPHYKERLERADMLSKIGKPFTHQEFRSLLRALHPDSSNPEYRLEMFNLVKERQVLLRPEEKTRPFSSNLPKSLAELLARKQAAEAKAKAAAKGKHKKSRKD